jgi:hypothetical protein
MTRPPFVPFEGYLETAFARRMESVLRRARRQRSWHVVVADPASGKSTSITELVRAASIPSGTLAGRSYPMLAVTAPKNDPKEQALGGYLLKALGLPVRGRWSERKFRLIDTIVRFGVECLIVDDAHDLSAQHLIFLKELTDHLALPPHELALGLCLVTAGRGTTMPLKDTLGQPETMWVQFRHRLDRRMPFCRIAGHTQDEVREILVALETLYRRQFPTLNLHQWTSAIYAWLTHPLLDPYSTGRVLMGYLMKFVTTALEQTAAREETDVSATTLEAAADLLTLRRDAIQFIDGEPNDGGKPGEEQKPGKEREPGDAGTASA